MTDPFKQRMPTECPPPRYERVEELGAFHLGYEPYRLWFDFIHQGAVEPCPDCDRRLRDVPVLLGRYFSEYDSKRFIDTLEESLQQFRDLIPGNASLSAAERDAMSRGFYNFIYVRLGGQPPAFELAKLASAIAQRFPQELPQQLSSWFRLGVALGRWLFVFVQGDCFSAPSGQDFGEAVRAAARQTDFGGEAFPDLSPHSYARFLERSGEWEEYRVPNSDFTMAPNDVPGIDVSHGPDTGAGPDLVLIESQAQTQELKPPEEACETASQPSPPNNRHQDQHYDEPADSESLARSRDAEYRSWAIYFIETAVEEVNHYLRGEPKTTLSVSHNYMWILGHFVPLSENECQILGAIVRSGHDGISRGELIVEALGKDEESNEDWAATDKTLQRAMDKIKAVLEDLFPEFPRAKFVENIKGVGWRPGEYLVGAVVR